MAREVVRSVGVPNDDILGWLEVFYDCDMSEVSEVVKQRLVSLRIAGMAMEVDEERFSQGDLRLAALHRMEMEEWYWRMMPEYVLSGQVDLVELIAMSVVELETVIWEEGDGDEAISANLIKAKQVFGRGSNQRRALVDLYHINCGGDSDLWGNDRQRIFPMEIREDDENGQRQAVGTVEAEELGLCEADLVRAWDCRGEWLSVMDAEVVGALTEAMRELELEESVIEELKRESVIVGVFRYMVMNCDDEIIDELMRRANQKLNEEVVRESEKHPLVVAARQLADQLTKVCDRARSFLRASEVIVEPVVVEIGGVRWRAGVANGYVSGLEQIADRLNRMDESTMALGTMGVQMFCVDVAKAVMDPNRCGVDPRVWARVLTKRGVLIQQEVEYVYRQLGFDVDNFEMPKRE